MEAVSGISKPFGDTLEILDFNYQNQAVYRPLAVKKSSKNVGKEELLGHKVCYI